MLARSLAAALVLAGALVACESDALPPVGQHASITGVVTDKATDAPIAGARIVVDAILVATTDRDGKFSIANVPIGDFDFSVQADGYETFDGSAKATGDKPYALDLALQKTEPQ